MIVRLAALAGVVAARTRRALPASKPYPKIERPRCERVTERCA